MNSDDAKTIMVTWHDAISYKKGDKVPATLTTFETTGILVKEDENYVIIEKPITINIHTGENHPGGEKPNFYLIPRGMIEKIKNL